MADQHCSIAGCGQPSVAALDVRALCRNHFIATCYEQIDDYSRWLEENRFREANNEQVRRFLSECTRQATELSQHVKDLDNLERARLLDILLRASDLGRHLRRSPRKETILSVRLACEILGRAWEEETKTRVISRYGASLECSHAVEIGDSLVLTRLDTNTQVRTRVAWRQARPGGHTDVGVEFLHCDNFWDIDWYSAEPVLWLQDELRQAN